MKRICFVCYGNICRSTMAEFVFKDMVKKRGYEHEFIIESKGTSSEELGNDTYYLTKEKLAENNIAFTKRKATKLKKEDYDDFDYFIGMDMMNVSSMNELFVQDKEQKVFRFLDITDKKRDIADPWYTRNFEQTYQDILYGCDQLFSWIQKK